MRLYRMLGVCGLGLMAMAPSVMAQRWEFGGGIGGSFYLSRDISNGSAKASAGIDTNIASGVWLGEDLSNKWGGEVRYDYQRGDAQLSSGGVSTSSSGESHAIHYDILWHVTPRGSKVRPFLGAGAGIKVYRVTGQELVSQPLSQFALLTKGNELEPLLSLGAGIKWQVAPSFQVRIEVHDYITPFPKEIITPNVGSHVAGVLQNIVPMLAIAYTF
jgi:Outer membrane protein beta-barrel domain